MKIALTTIGSRGDIQPYIALGIELFRMQKWSFVTGILVSGFWIYGCLGGINLVLYDLLVEKQLTYQSPIGAWTDAILFILVTIWAIILVIYLWRIRKILL